jgi:selenocysteine-specific elongation factor
LTAPESIQRVIVGTAGHIDHGKSSLVKQLTGTDPDRLQEEKERGMTIDLGFARYRGRQGHLVGIIDVPGHERFIKNMVAGATSVDVVLLVVAADDGVMPQTREHLEILSLLGLQRGLIVLTKADLVERELLGMAREDVRELLRGTFLEAAPIVVCSNLTGEGMDEVRERLDELIEQATPRSPEGLFRLPIQRVFSAKGHGTVITGVPLSGHVAIGDELEILPGHHRGRIRGIQAYGQARPQAAAGHSCALNVSEVDYQEVRRGMVAGPPDCFEAASLFEARLQTLPGRAGPLKHRAWVRVHVGTAELMGRVAIVDREQVAPGEDALVQLELAEPVVACRGDRFLIRQASPMVTLGGGVLFGPARHHRRRLRDHHVTKLRERESSVRSTEAAARFAAEQRRFQPFTLAELCVDVGMTREEGGRLLERLSAAGDLVAVGRTHWLSGAMLAQARRRVLEALEELHRAHPLKKLLEIRVLRAAVDLPEPVVKAVLELAVCQGAVTEGTAGTLRLSSHRPALTEEDERLLDEVRATFLTADLQPPSAAEVAKRLGAEARHLERLLGLLCDEGELQRVGTLYFHRHSLQKARAALIENGKRHGSEIMIPELRDTLGSSRKFMIPLLEYFDAAGITVRRGDKRYLRESRLGETEG